MKLILRTVRTIKVLHPIVNELKFKAQFFFRRLFRVPHEKHFKVLKLFPKEFFDGKVIFDVGANRGQSIQSIRLFTDEQIISFEPNPSLAKMLKKNSTKTELIVNKGLGANKNKLKLFMPSYRGVPFDGLASTSIAEAIVFFNKQRFFCFDERNISIDETEVIIDILDAYIEPCSLIKLDVQGAEIDVLKGASSTIAQHKPIIFIERPSLDLEVSYLRKFDYLPYKFLNGKLIPGHEDYNIIFLTEEHLRAMDLKNA